MVALIAGSSGIGVRSAPAPVPVSVDVALRDTESWIMGPSGFPIPPPWSLPAITDRFVDPPQPHFAGQPQFPVDAMNALFTPEGLYPIIAVKNLQFDQSVAQGLTILNATIDKQLGDGTNLVVVGYSQSSTIGALEMRNLLELPEADRPTADQLSFVLLGSPSNPNGGFLERFGDPSLPPLSMPTLGLTFSGAAPADTPWQTAFYTTEYDGFADFPRYPINVLADINAFLGIAFQHGAYPFLTDARLAAAVELPVSADYTGETRYFMIPTEHLPLLEPLRLLPLLGNPLADLLEPDLRVLVNLGYGNIDNGWDSGPANLPTPYGLLPTDLNPADVLAALANGAQQGVQDALVGLGSLSNAFGSDAVTSPSPPLDTPTDPASDLPTGLVDTFTKALATSYATLLPTADIVSFLLTTLPAYNVSLVLGEVASGNLVDAVGLPIAADTGLLSLAMGFELRVISGALSSIVADAQHAFSF